MDNTDHHSHRFLYKFGLVLLVIALVFTVIIYFFGFKFNIFNRWATDQHVGVIREINEDSLIIVDQNGKERQVTITDSTKIMAGSRAIDKKSLTLDMRVIIIGEPDNKNGIDSEIIRIFKENNK